MSNAAHNQGRRGSSIGRWQGCWRFVVTPTDDVVATLQAAGKPIKALDDPRESDSKVTRPEQKGSC